MLFTSEGESIRLGPAESPTPDLRNAAVLLLWIYVVYNKNRWVLALMSVCYLGEAAAVMTILTISFETFEGARPDLRHWKSV